MILIATRKSCLEGVVHEDLGIGPVKPWRNITSLPTMVNTATATRLWMP